MAAAANKMDDRPSGSYSEKVAYNPWRIEAMPAGLIDSPLDFIFADHHRQREASQVLMLVAVGEFDREGIERLLEFLETDFELHIGDEEIALFPILRQYCLEEDNVDRIIDRLKDEHREDEAINVDVIAILKKRLSGGGLTEKDSSRLRKFAEHIRQHLALENGVLLPLARVRLDRHVQEMLARLLKDRR